MICPPCKRAGKLATAIREGAPTDDISEIPAWHAQCESPDCPCHHEVHV